MINFKNKKVLISGGSSGIGKAIVENFLKNDAFVVNLDKKEPDIIHENYFYKNFNFANLDQIEEVINNLKIDFDILVNNVGIVHKANMLETTVSEFKNVFDINFMSAFALTQCLSNNFIKNKKSGKIVNISSINAKVGISSQFSYAISKAAINHLTRLSAITLAEHNILVNAICPGSIKTEILKGAYKDADSYVKARTPLNRWGDPFEIANLALFLASDLNTYMTGECINIDGGRLSLNFFKK